ncbi:MAG: AAA family ATPase [Lachnospiraceae bacterium]|nr:AAA family ATPase [Lachnospiraceae bacterium]
MTREVSIGTQDFGLLREDQCFYIDKTAFIKEWWEGKDAVTLITRPRRFGKTLNMSMLDYFFSNQHAGRSDLFEGLEIWQDEKFRGMQGKYPVIFLSFAGVKQDTYEKTRKQINKLLVRIYEQHSYLLESDNLSGNEKQSFQNIKEDMDEVDAGFALNQLSVFLEKHYGRKVLIFLDEYDTPLQEAYINGYWNELTAFIRMMFNNTFKTNPSMERAVMTGITRVSRESIFSDLNNLIVVTTTSDLYATSFGFTEEEVFAAIKEQGIAECEQAEVKKWYDGFTFGTVTDIYNPWSITHYLKLRKFDSYWANSSGNGLVGHLLQSGDADLKMEFENLLRGGFVEVAIDEQIIFDQLDTDIDAVWSLLLASGYLKYIKIIQETNEDIPVYQMALTNFEVKRMFHNLIKGWFKKSRALSKFVTAMLQGDVRSMNYYINDVALYTFSSFDSGNQPSEKEPERFYHGFVLGLLVENAPDYIVKSNRESGFGRYDVVLEPKDKNNVAVILEFKVYDQEYDGEKDLSDTADNALAQIEEKKYTADLIGQGIAGEKIFKYGLAFKGKKCFIKRG